MSQHVTLTPSQLAFHQAAKERAWRKIEAARRNGIGVRLSAPEPDMVDDEATDCQPAPKPTKVIIEVRFDDHVMAFRRWQKEVADNAARPLRGYIAKRAAELLRNYDDVVSRSRSRIDVFPRHLTIWEIKTILRPDMSLPAIGRIYGIDHTSALHARDRIQKMADEGKLEEAISEHIDLVKAARRSHKKARAE